jgi:hypothetical protein
MKPKWVGWLVDRPSTPLDQTVAVPVGDRLWRIAVPDTA